ncbi:hypothetical protein G7Y89_g9377 [Cudoniella acicularis]|uniref:Uncharacterized protein n=1 Tax=Cudoniella acicularis TaxID=354080 RepID=A0A8H4RES6_9HELO|nr:hypothetical protein G7Y89_g9377 [Cudoniella acicularis]
MSTEYGVAAAVFDHDHKVYSIYYHFSIVGTFAANGTLTTSSTIPTPVPTSGSAGNTTSGSGAAVTPPTAHSGATIVMRGIEGAVVLAFRVALALVL